MITYTMSEEAQQLFDELLDEHVAEFNKQYPSGSGQYWIRNEWFETYIILFNHVCITE